VNYKTAKGSCRSGNARQKLKIHAEGQKGKQFAGRQYGFEPFLCGSQRGKASICIRNPQISWTDQPHFT